MTIDEQKKQKAIEKTEAILEKAAAPGEYRLMWSQRVKDTKFVLMAYMVRGEIIIAQIWDNGGVEHFTKVNTTQWDATEKIILEYLKPADK